MPRILVTGSSGGLGLLTGRMLLADGHDVVFHARHDAAAAKLREELPAETPVVVGDLRSIDGTRSVGVQAAGLGTLDTVIHNAGMMSNERKLTSDGIPELLAVNVVAPYVLTAVLGSVPRHVYLSSSMHRVELDLEDFAWTRRLWNGTRAYFESKLHVTALAFAYARLRPSAYANAVDPGWVPTRMGGAGAPDDLPEGCRTQVALAAGEGPLAALSGRYLHHMTVQEPASEATRHCVQDRILEECGQLSGLQLVASES